MKITSYALGRPSYWDRNPVTVVQNYSDVLAPHAQTTRWTTTVAAGRKMNVELANVRVVTTTVATTKGAYNYASIYIVSGAVTFSLCDLLLPTNTVNAPVYFQMTGVPTLYSGETLYGVTSDNSTGGTVQYLVAAKATDYAA